MTQRFQRTYLAFFLLLVTGTVTLVAVLLYMSYQDKQAQVEVNAVNVVAVLEERLNATLRRTQAELDALAHSTSADALKLSARDQYAASIQQQLALHAKLFPEIVGLRLIDAQGNVLYASDQLLPQANVADRSYFLALRQHPEQAIVFSEVTTGRINRSLQLHIAVPIRGRHGTLLGLAMAPLDIAYFQQLFDAVNLGPHGVITFRRIDDGRLVLRHPARPGTINQVLQNNPMHMQVVAGAMQGIIHYQSAIDMVDRVYAFRRVGNYPFYVAAGIASGDFLGQWRNTLLGTCSMVSLMLLVLGILLWRLQLAEARRQHATGELQASEDRFQLLLNSVGEGICGIDRQGHYIFSNPAARSLLGYAGEKLLRGQDILQLLHGDSDLHSGQVGRISKTLQRGLSVHEDDAVFRRADGSLLQVQYDAYPLVKDGEDVGAVLLFQDIAERKQQQAQIAFLAHHDPLTALPNRILAEDRLQQAIAVAVRQQQQIAMLFLDLDGFKTINDSLGHDIGDEMLQAVAVRLLALLRDNDTVCRLGGDEFLLLLPGVTQLQDLLPLIERLLHGLQQPFVLEDYQLSTSASIGVALFPGDGRDFTTLMKKADIAMYHAKDAGRNTYCLFDEAMNVQAQETLRLRSQFLRGLEQGEFVLHYQPELRLSDRQVLGAEALVRWQDASGRLIPPAEFIPMAESSGLIVPLGEWVLGEACRQARLWQSLYPTPLVVAVNISAIQFKRGNLVQSVAEALLSSGLPAHLLELELTESTLLQQTDTVISTLQKLRELGVRLSIDDFGTGYSSLAYLKRLAVNKLKIDQSFIRNLEQDPDDASIVRAIIDMAHRLNLQTLAEGVENGRIADLLAELGCDQVQGYHFARPQPVAEFQAWLRRQGMVSPSAETG